MFRHHIIPFLVSSGAPISKVIDWGFAKDLSDIGGGGGAVTDNNTTFTLCGTVS